MPWTAKFNQGITLTIAQPQPQPKISKYEENPKKNHYQNCQQIQHSG